MRIPLLILSAVFLSGLAACRTGSVRPASDDASAARVYEVRGRVLDVNAIERTVMVAHEDIPGLMPAMTMPFSVRDVEELERVAPGEAVQFRLHMTTGAAWIDGITPVPDSAVPAASIEDDGGPEAAPSDESIYVHDAVWTDQQGRQVRLADLQGSPVVISMIFTRCGYACPRIVHDMKAVAAGLPADQRERVRYVLVSIDPEYDTPDKLRLFADGHGLDAEQWTLLQGQPSDVRMLAALLGVRYKKDANGLYSHTNLVTVLDSGGEIAHRQFGLGTDPAGTVSVLNGLFASGS